MTRKTKVPRNIELREDSQSFERFERLAKGLMVVPKKELDRELKKHELNKNLQRKSKTHGR